jgi:regulator of nucleoside diphosphate kinase
MLLSRRVISAQDNEKLIGAVDRARESWVTYAPYVDLFRAELRRAPVVPSADVPPDVITMNSRFALTDPDTGRAICYTLVYPGSDAAEAGRLSVVSPMGMALLGARVGEDVCWDSVDGPQVATVTRLLYQPEAAGDPHR